MIINLQEMCKAQIAEMIALSILTKFPRPLPVPMSNSIFHAFLFNEVSSEENIQHIRKMLTVKHVCLDMTDLDCDGMKAVFKQDLEGIELMELRSWKQFHRRRVTWDGNRNKPPLILFSDVIEKLLSHYSRYELKHLAVDGSEVELVGGFMQSIREQLPNLRSLILDTCGMLQPALTTLFDYYPRISKLDISAAKIQNLAGISNLENLELLTISEIDFQTEKDIKELFKCKKLRVLCMAGCMENKKLRSNTFTLFLKCKKVLPELRMLDCSYCNISEKQLQRFLKNQTKLELVSLIGTPIEKRPSTVEDYYHLKLLTIGTFKDCLDSLTHYGGQKRFRRLLMERVLKEIHIILKKNYQKIPEKEKDSCFDKMCWIYSEVGLYRCVLAKAIECLEELSRNERALNLTYGQRQHLVNIVCTDVPDNQDSEPDKNNMMILTKVSEILNNDILIRNREDNYEPISKVVVEIMNNPRNDVINGPIHPIMCCLHKLLKILEDRLPETLELYISLLKGPLDKQLERFFRPSVHNQINQNRSGRGVFQLVPEPWLPIPRFL